MTTPNTNTRPTQTTLPSNIKPLVTALAACFAFAASPAIAATYTVTNTNDSGAGSLRDVISNSANGDGIADTINFAAGLNGQTVTLTSDQINITDTASLIIDASALAGGITLSGNNASRIFGIQSQAPTRLDNLTLIQGRTTAHSSNVLDCATAATFTRGGAICAEGSLVLIDSTVSGNSTMGNRAHGGGFFASGDTTLTNSTISNNSTAGSQAFGGGFVAYGVTTLSNSTVSGNSTAGSSGRGGGFYAIGDITLNNSTVSGNSTAGGNAYGGGFWGNGDTILNNSTVSNNSTGGGHSYGGGFYSYGLVSTLTLNNSTVSNNSTAGYFARGGGFSAHRGATTLNNSTVSNNSTTGVNARGGGFYARGDATLNNSTISQNQAQHATAVGDGLVVLSSTATLTLNSSILSGNGTDNFASTNSPTVNVNNSLFGDNETEITSSGGTNTDNVFNNTPVLGGLADNGCAVMTGAAVTAACVHTHGLLVTSPALDAGDDNGETTDQRGIGFPRVVGAQADIGAFEFSPIIPGDCTGDGAINISDVVCTINIVLGGGVAVNGADCNASGGAVDISDVICTINEVLNP